MQDHEVSPDPFTAGSFWKSSEGRSALAHAVVIFLFAFLILTVGSGLEPGFRDSPLFALAIDRRGIPHPPGSPVYLLAAGLFSKLIPLQTWRGTTLFSAFCGALTLSFLTALAWRLVHDAFVLLPSRIKSACAIMPAVFLMAWCPAFIEQSHTTEQYTLLTAFLAGLMLLLREWEDRPHGGVAFAAGLVAGLAAGNHLSQVVLPLAVAAVGWRVDGGNRRRLGVFALLAALGWFMGMASYLFVILRSREHPMLDWGNMDSLGRLWWGLSRQQWKSRPLSQVPPGFVSAWLASYAEGVSIIAALLACVGGVLAAHFRLVRRGLWPILLAVVPYAAGLLLAHLRQKGMSVAYVRDYGVTDWHLPIYMVLALMAAYGVAFLCSRAHRPDGRTALPVGIILILIASLVPLGGDLLGESSESPPFAEQVLASVPEDAVIIVSSDTLSFTLGYRIASRNSPARQSIAWTSPSLPAFAERILASGKPWNEAERVRFFSEVVDDPQRCMLRHGSMQGPVLTEYSPATPAIAKYMLPRGFLVELLDHETTDDEVRSAATMPTPKLPSAKERVLPGERAAWAEVFERRGDFFAMRGMNEEALASYKQASELLPRCARLWLRMGESLELMKQLDAAERMYTLARDKEFHLPGPRVGLALAAARRKEFTRARDLLREELEIDPTSAPATSWLARIESDMAAGGAE